MSCCCHRPHHHHCLCPLGEVPAPLLLQQLIPSLSAQVCIRIGSSSRRAAAIRSAMSQYASSWFLQQVQLLKSYFHICILLFQFLFLPIFIFRRHTPRQISTINIYRFLVETQIVTHISIFERHIYWYWLIHTQQAYLYGFPVRVLTSSSCVFRTLSTCNHHRALSVTTDHICCKSC
jgi:hypothetical protein